jgi:beta-lactamase class A
MMRLVRDEARQKRVRISRNYGMFIAIVVIASIVVAGVAGGNAVIQLQKADTIRRQHAPTTAINDGLAGEIKSLSEQMELPGDLDQTLLPAGAQVSVSVIDLSDKNRGTVHYNDQIQWNSASTYKLFVATEMSRQVESGKLTWNSPLNRDTLSDCLYQMIHVSDNNCPEAWLGTYSSFDQLTQTAKGIGGQQTDFSYGNMRTSGADLANLLSQLYQGKLMNQTDTQNLLNLMEQQQYRDGIPSGIQANITAGKAPAGTLVANKVGFVDDYTGPVLNDASLVVSPNGTYVLVIMTNGYSWDFVAQLAQWIDSQME